jgi:periplasmic divalent cation tolerance protein
MHIVIMVTAKDRKEGHKIIQALLKKRLIACGNMIDKVSSFFWWDRKIDEAHEVLLILKTKQDKFDQITQVIKKAHSYEVPEIIALPIVASSEDYAQWMNKAVK